MIEDLLGSRAKVRILRALVMEGSDGLTTDEIARTTGQSTGTVVPALKQLDACGSLLIEVDGRSKRYRLAPRHPDAEAVTRMFQDEARRIEERLEGIVRRSAKGRVRYAGWTLDQRMAAESSRDAKGPSDHKVHVLVLCRDVAKVRRALIAALPSHSGTKVEVLDEEDASRRIRQGDESLIERIERGRILFVDRGWLDERRSRSKTKKQAKGASSGRPREAATSSDEANPQPTRPARSEAQRTT